MTDDAPFSVVRGEDLRRVCTPPPPVALPDYYAIQAPEGFVVLMPKALLANPPAQAVPTSPTLPVPEKDRDKDRQFSDALSRLKVASPPKEWTATTTPYTDLGRALATAGSTAEGRACLTGAIASQRELVGSVDTFMAAILMAASAKWREVVPHARGLAARGWFIGRWLPTSLVVTGPISRFVAGDGLRHVTADAVKHVRAIRRFIQDPVVLRLRNALAHWSFEWESRPDGNYVVSYDRHGVFSLHQQEADAVHIVMVTVVELLHEHCIRPRHARARLDDRAEGSSRP